MYEFMGVSNPGLQHIDGDEEIENHEVAENDADRDETASDDARSFQRVLVAITVQPVNSTFNRFYSLFGPGMGNPEIF